MIGPAYTVKYVRKNYENEPKPAGHYVQHSFDTSRWLSEVLTLSQIDDVPEDAILFISAPPKMLNACYGGLMSTRAQYLGVAGTVIDGRLRDLQEHRDLNYPV